MRVLCSERAPELALPMRTNADNEEQSGDRMTGLIGRALKW
jgi:hypothetical protein